MSEKLGSYQKHIDNGGISVEITKDASFICIEMSASYFGYPSVSSNLSGSDISADDLQAIGLAFLNAAQKMKDSTGVSSRRISNDDSDPY